MVGYLCIGDPAVCLASCSSLPSANLPLCYSSCLSAVTGNSSCVPVDTDSFVSVDTVFSDSCSFEDVFYRDVESSFFVFLPVFLSIFCVYVVVRVLSLSVK